MSVKTKPKRPKRVIFSKDLQVIKSDAKEETQSETEQNRKESEFNNIRENTINRAQKNLTKTLLYVCGAFIICWTGNELYVLLHYVWRPFTWTEWYYYVSVLAVSANG